MFLFFRAYLDETSVNRPSGTFYAEPSEQDTVNHTIQEITLLPQLVRVREWLQTEEFSWECLCNFASFVVQEETVSAHFNMQNVGGAAVEQKMLAIGKRKEPQETSVDTSWTQFFSASPGFSADNSSWIID